MSPACRDSDAVSVMSASVERESFSSVITEVVDAAAAGVGEGEKIHLAHKPLVARSQQVRAKRGKRE